MPSTRTIRFAVIGSGPAGCYFAQTLLRGLPAAEITIFDRLASPFGLVRYGVAADHQHTKAIARQFERLFQHPAVRFSGNIEIDRDVTLDELRAAYDVVVLATGLSADRRLGIPGETLAGIYGAGAITRVLNSHPAEPPSLPKLGSDVVIIGGGNVTVDVLRFLIKDRSGYAASDVSDEALDAYLANPAQRVTVLHRSPPAAAKSDPQMLKELAALPRGHYSSPELPSTDPVAEDDRQGIARLQAFTELTRPDREPTSAPEVLLRFGVTPVAFSGSNSVEGVTIKTASGYETIPATAVITAIGFDQSSSSEIEALTAEPAPTGRIERGLYRTGWAKRGPHGAIPENRACAKQVVDEVLSDIGADLVPLGAPGFDSLSEEVRSRSVSYNQWVHLDEYEREQAPADRVRRKSADHEEMLKIARQAN